MPQRSSTMEVETKPRILVVEDEEPMLELLRAILSISFAVDSSMNGKGAVQKVRHKKYDAVILDIRLPDIDGLEVLTEIRKIDENLNAVMVTGIADVKTVVAAMKLGAYDYITKPFRNDDLIASAERAAKHSRLQREVEHLRTEVFSNDSFKSIIEDSPAMAPVLNKIEKVKDSGANVLVTGESGTGKELVARAIHYLGRWRNGPFVGINCACFVDTLLDNELFGHEKGAFTGADAPYPGRFEQADDGTLFLDEVTTMSPGAQAKLLRALDQKRVQRLGGTTEIEANVRIISATNQDIEEAITRGEFREDLYYRLKVVTIEIPPLRDRKEDIPGLLRFFLHKYFVQTGRKFEGATEKAMEYLFGHDWKGNIRQLENVIEQCAILEEGNLITERYLPKEILRIEGVSPVERVSEGGLRKEVEQTEKRLILSALESSRWNVVKAAKKLHLHRNTLRNKMARYHIKPRRRK